jgi:hypothetical protein
MMQEVGDAIQLLQKALTLAPEKAVAPVKQATQLLLQALKDNQGNDPDKGGGG